MLLNLVADNFSDKKVLFFGLYKPFVKNPIACIFRNRRNIFMNKNIDSTLANDYYNRTKVALNIHSEQQKDGANPRLFEIAGTKTYQICDANPYIENLFKNEEIGLYHNNGELISLIKKVSRALIAAGIKAHLATALTSSFKSGEKSGKV